MGYLRYTAPSNLESRPEKPLFSPLAIVFCFLLLVSILVILFPGNALTTQLQNQDYISDVDYRYSVLLAANKPPITPKAITDSPLAVLQQLDDNLKTQSDSTIWYNYIILKTILYTPTITSQVKDKAIAVLNNYLNAFKTVPVNFKQDVRLAEDALTIEKASTALYFYEQAINKDPQQTVYFYAKVAQTALWAEECVKSSKYNFVAQDKSTLLDDKRYFYILALKTLFQCNEMDRAIVAAEQHIDGLRNDPLTYQLLTELAIKADEPAKAQLFVLKLLQLQQGTNH